ncbi:MAG: hypothetical protein KJN99_11660, partial [Marinicaulis sp.]|nr:hypothetical protein [Marinicaulis sp.]
PVIDPDDAPVMPATSTEDLLNSLGTDSADDAGAAPSDAAPLTEAEILDALGSDAPPASEDESEAAPEESDEQPQ